MGWFLRKSFRVGPLRLNLSKSGLGLSGGVTGFRVGVGPRGSYVHAGRGGLYFRQRLGPGPQRDQAESFDATRPMATVGEGIAIESTSALEIVDASADDLLAEVNAKRQKIAFLPIAWGLATVGGLGALGSGQPMVILGAIGVSTLMVLGVAALDRSRRMTQIAYDLESSTDAAYKALQDAFAFLESCQRLWHVEATAEVRDGKYHAGGTSLLNRSSIRTTAGTIPLIEMNLPVPTLPVGKQLLAFTPDRLLVVERRAVGAVPYGELRIEVRQDRFIEHGPVPGDAQVVDRTWQYVNRGGGPDRRFSNNPELPIVLYESVRLTSPSGLHEMIQCSRLGFGARLQEAIARL